MSSKTKSLKQVEGKGKSTKSKHIEEVDTVSDEENVPKIQKKLKTTVTKTSKNKIKVHVKGNENDEDEQESKTPKKSGGLRDIEQIVADPVKYANNITVERLVTILQKMSDFYYAEAKPIVDDEVYDAMIDVLKERDPNNAYLFQTGVEKTTDKDVNLPYYMPSLNKIKPGEKSLYRWFKTYGKGPYVIMDKLDGISVQIYKNDKGETDMFTKKQTGVGTSKNHLLNYFVDKKVLDKIPKGTSIRGEVVISKKNFEEIQKFEPDLKNPRSAMAGLMNTDKIDVRIAKKAQFVTYNILHPRYTYEDQLKYLKKWGFNIVWHKKYTFEELQVLDDEDEEEIEGEEADDDIPNLQSEHLRIEKHLKKLLEQRIEQSDYLIDGIVVADESKTYEHTDSNPKHMMAFKMNSLADMKEAIVEKVIWEPTMYGYLQPVVQIKPVVLAGNTTVTYATAHNAKKVKDDKIGKGTVIMIVKSGGVIPYIVKIVKPSKKPDLPDIAYKWTDSGVDIMAVKPSKEIQRKVRILQIFHFFRKLGVKFLSTGIISKFYDAGYETIESIVSSASTKDKDPYNIDRLGQKMVEKIYDQIDRAFKKVKLFDLMSGSLKFGRGLGSRKIKEILNMYPNILEMRNSSEEEIKEKIMEVPGFSDISATKFAENLKSFCEFLDTLKDNCDYDLSFKTDKKTKKAKKVVKKDDTDEENNEDDDIDMSDQKVVLTGFRSDVITDFIENHGGKVSGSVSKNTTLVLYTEKDKTGSKLQKARELGITLMSREEFVKKYNIDE